MGRRLFWIVAGLVVAACTVSAQSPQQPSADAPVFRADTRVIPLDVRVLDRNGRPVTDLTAADFIVEEDGIRQEIRHFSIQALTADPSAADAPLVRRAGQAVAIEPQNRRVFLLFLGRGDLTGPSNGIDGVLHFVRNRLLPQDRVAILSWNRASDFTTDHASVIALLERFKSGYRKVDRQIVDYFRSPVYFYGDRARMPSWIQADIDAIFEGPERAAMRTVSPAVFADADQMDRDLRETFDLFSAPGNDPFAAARLGQLGASLEEFLQDAQQTIQDQNNLYASIEYLRHIEGEKHLIYVAEYGLNFGRWEYDRNIGRTAADGRIVLHTIRTGGTVLTGAPSAEHRRLAPYSSADAMRAMRALLPAETSRNLAAFTGGRSDANRFPNASIAADHIDLASRFQYLLGYYPTNGAWDGRFRNVRITVNRRDVTVLHRFGYYGRQDVGPLDRRAVVTYGRITTAAASAVEIPNLGLQATATMAGDRNNRHVRVNMTIDISRVTFELTDDGRHAASLDIAIFGLDRRQQPVGEFQQAIALELTDVRLAEIRASGLPMSIPIPVTADADSLKVVVYDYAGDLTGSLNVTVGR